jgi:hypothetical protein
MEASYVCSLAVIEFVGKLAPLCQIGDPELSGLGVGNSDMSLVNCHHGYPANEIEVRVYAHEAQVMPILRRQWAAVTTTSVS